MNRTSMIHVLKSFTITVLMSVKCYQADRTEIKYFVLSRSQSPLLLRRTADLAVLVIPPSHILLCGITCTAATASTAINFYPLIVIFCLLIRSMLRFLFFSLSFFIFNIKKKKTLWLQPFCCNFVCPLANNQWSRRQTFMSQLFTCCFPFSTITLSFLHCCKSFLKDAIILRRLTLTKQHVRASFLKPKLYMHEKSRKFKQYEFYASVLYKSNIFLW